MAAGGDTALGQSKLIRSNVKISPAKGQEQGPLQSGEPEKNKNIRLETDNGYCISDEKTIPFPLWKHFFAPGRRQKNQRRQPRAERRPAFFPPVFGASPIRRWGRPHRRQPARLCAEGSFSPRPWRRFRPCPCRPAFCRAGQRAGCSWCSNP